MGEKDRAAGAVRRGTPTGTDTMSATLWGDRPPPTAGRGATAVWEWHLRTPADVTAARTRLRDEAAAQDVATADDVQRLLLSFEELASNGVRHGRAPVRVRVSVTAAGWLIDVTDAAVGRPPTPAIDRDAADGGLGLYLVARLAAAHGWTVRGTRKHVWALVDRAPADRRTGLRLGADRG
jgi:anti-sigma regulatory factor (Ser/Thr protein kinase)